ncbi:MAG: 16S rRNA (uracil(1498)-N(3))-methyltransferase [Flavobacteriaceae bacterium]
MQLFYDKNIDKNDTQFTFNKLESKHIVKVLRKKNDDVLFITNGKGYLFHSKIVNANDKQCLVEIEKIEKQELKLNYKLHIAIAPTKNSQRIEWFLEKATEIGVTEITLLLCHHSERKVVKMERLVKVIVTAMKQSKRYYLPKLNQVVKFKSFIVNNSKADLFIAHCEDFNKNSFKNSLVKGNDITLLIGPEGDFSIDEINYALENNFKSVSLGNSILRTETAGIVAVHSVAYANE